MKERHMGTTVRRSLADSDEAPVDSTRAGEQRGNFAGPALGGVMSFVLPAGALVAYYSISTELDRKSVV